jgi:dipeptidyl-peptidase 4
MRNLRLRQFVPLFVAVTLSLAIASTAQAQVPDLAAGKQLTVERIYGKPSLSGSSTQGIEWSPDGKQLSFLQKTGQGPDARNELRVMDVATGQQRTLIDAEKLATLLPASKTLPPQQTGLGRVTPRRYLWSRDGHAIVFISGANLIWYDLRTQSSKQLLISNKPVEDPKISPDSRWVSFIREHNLWVVSIESGKETQVTRGGSEDFLEGELDWVYPEELDIHTAYWWSPDSQRLAFLEMDERQVTKYPIVDYLSYTGETHTMRYPKAGDANPMVRVGIVGTTGGKISWVETGKDTDIYIARVDWLPDSQRLAIQLINRAQNRLDLMLANAETGAALAIHTEMDRYWVNVTDDLYFFRDGKRFLWSSERGGFRHLYLYDIGGNEVEQLTSGNWEVMGVEEVDEARGYIYFTSTEKSPIERHLYRISLADKKITRLTKQDGTHTIQMSPDASAYVDTYSNSMTPPRQNLYHADGRPIAPINTNEVAELAEYHLSPVEFLTLPGADGTRLNALMIKPPDFDPSRKYPVIVNLYGGPHAQLVRNAWGGPNFLWHEMMAQKGFIIFTVDNRGMAGRGHNFEIPIYHRFGVVELADQLAGVKYLKSLPYVDGARIGIWGWSYGGYMTVTAMFRAPGVFKAGFAGAPVTDWRQYDTIYTERYMGQPQENPDGYKDSSPVNHAGQLQGKLLIAHGSSDDNVHFANTVELVEKLIQADKYAEITIYPGRGHPISDPPARIQLFQRVTRFFLDNL